MAVAQSSYQFRTAGGASATLTFIAGDGLQVHIDGQLVHIFPEQFIRDALTVVDNGVNGLVERIDAVGAVAVGKDHDAMLDFIEAWGRQHV